MKLSLETIGRTYAAGRNYINYFLGMATSLGFVSASQSKTLTESLNEIYTGIAAIVHGFTSIWQIGVVTLGPLATIILAWWAQRSAKTINQAAAVTAVANDSSDPVKAREASAAILTSVVKLDSVVNKDTVIKVNDKALADAVPSNNVVAK